MMILMGGNGRHISYISHGNPKVLRELFWFCGGTGTPNNSPNKFLGAFSFSPWDFPSLPVPDRRYLAPITVTSQQVAPAIIIITATLISACAFRRPVFPELNERGAP